MALLNYSNCSCKNSRCENVVALANIVSVNVCNIIDDYSKMGWFTCRWLKEKEGSLMKEPYLHDDGLEKAEAQFLLFRSMFNNDITQLHLHPHDSKSCRKTKINYVMEKK